MILSNNKHIWEMRRRAYVQFQREDFRMCGVEWLVAYDFCAEHEHEYHVRLALNQGLAVPPEVLADYPELNREIK